MKTSDMMTFTNPEFGSIRTLTIDGEPWFVGKDVAERLGYSNARDAVLKHVDAEDKTVIQKSQIATLEIPNRGLNVINESGLYSLVLSSKLEGAKRFKRWVTADVLPSIRKTGGYIAGEEKMTDEELFMQALLVAKRKLDERNAEYAKLEKRHEALTADHRALTAEANTMRPKAEFADAVSASEDCIPLGDLAKLLKQNGVDIGRTRLFDYLRRNGYLISQYGSSYNCPTQSAMEKKLFRLKESLFYRGDFEHINKQTLVTGKGQRYFINKFLSENKEAKK